MGQIILKICKKIDRIIQESIRYIIITNIQASQNKDTHFQTNITIKLMKINDSSISTASTLKIL